MSWIPIAAAAGTALLGSLFGGDSDDEEAQRQVAEAQAAARNAEHLANQMKARSDELQKQVDDYKIKQQELMDNLEKEVNARAAQDEKHQQALAKMREDGEREREEHKKEMKEFRKEALKSEERLLETRLSDLKRERGRLNRAYNEDMGQAEELQRQVHAETVKLQQFTPELNDPSIKRIVLLGLTGDGKSTVGNRLLGDRSDDGDQGGPNGGFRTSGGVDSETQSVMKVLHEAFGVKISVVDTPGIADSGGRGKDRQHISNLVAYLRGCGGVNQFLITKNQSNPRLSSTYQGMLREMDHALGVEFWNFVTVVLTHVEGKRALRDFPAHRDELVGQISELFETPPLKAVGIGMEDYDEVVEDIITQVVPNEKFSCEKLISPLEELEEELQAMTQKSVESKELVDEVLLKIRQVQERLADIATQLQKHES